ncbi:NAD-dependent epimerase/dehydratase family protein [Butyrivibrio sp. M55]|uniref:NAD-dependent epimerase/dehydratase family protein n=1 Tax=Butyrivibrio sp. M55 TaxID=1855323 RepID=UPI0008E3C8BC|nr:NAD(P)-dependent oxidoreductase [Butyrivibrio sp. M55]SFU42207.1 Nucleoside-diphosphate-sugar epimerase [Butyrivibrio sp. M55]
MKNNGKIAIVTGAFGFAGANLTEHLLDYGYKVYAIGRKGSSHNDRFSESESLKKVLIDMEDYDKICGYIDDDDISGAEAIALFHLSWGGARDDFDTQRRNIDASLLLLDSAHDIKDKCLKSKNMDVSIRVIGIGSQAEYGVKSGPITEDLPLEPFTAYGSCKAAAYYLTESKARILGIDFIWGRIFSLIGKYEPSGRMLPDVVRKLAAGEEVSLSSCEQYWDYLDAGDAADAIIALFEKGVTGEVYNIANGDCDRLMNFVKRAAKCVGADESLISYGNRANPFVSLEVSGEKIKKDTGWEPKVSFEESIKYYR